MDSESEQRILKNLEDYFEGRTVLFCTHRTSFIEKATRVIILNNNGIQLDISADEYLRKMANVKEISHKKMS